MEALTIGRQFIDAGHPVTRVLKILNISRVVIITNLKGIHYPEVLLEVSLPG